MRPAIKPTTGLGWGRVLLYFSRYSAASSSIEPPISPMITMPFEICQTVKSACLANLLTLGIRVLEEELDDINMFCAGERVTANADAKRLSEADVSCLRDSLVGESSRTGHNADLAWLVNVSGLNTHLAPQRVDDTRAVRSDEARFRLALECIHNL